jgi:hypothetical protein
MQKPYRKGEFLVGRSAIAEGTFRMIVGFAILALNAWLLIRGKLN